MHTQSHKGPYRGMSFLKAGFSDKQRTRAVVAGVVAEVQVVVVVLLLPCPSYLECRTAEPRQSRWLVEDGLHAPSGLRSECMAVHASACIVGRIGFCCLFDVSAFVVAVAR